MPIDGLEDADAAAGPQKEIGRIKLQTVKVPSPEAETEVALEESGEETVAVLSDAGGDPAGDGTDQRDDLFDLATEVDLSVLPEDLTEEEV